MSALLVTVDSGSIYLILLGSIFLSSIIEIGFLQSTGAFNARAALFCMNLVLVVLFVGLRWNVGTDWDNYKELFDSLELNSQFILNVYHFDLGYVFLNAVVKAVVDNYTVFLVVCAALAGGLVGRLIVRLSPLYNLSLLIFVCSYLPIHFFGSTRRGIAIAAASVFFTAIASSKPAGCLKWFFIAVSFHRSAVISAIVWLEKRICVRTQTVAVILAISVVAGASGATIRLLQYAASSFLGFSGVELVDSLIYYGETFEEHTPEGVDAFSLGLVSLLRKAILIFFFLQVVSESYEREDSEAFYRSLLKIYLIGTAIYSAFIGAPIFQVLSVYFLFLEVFLIPMCFVRLSPQLRYIFLFYVIGTNIAQYVSALNVYPELFFPYQSVIS